MRNFADSVKPESIRGEILDAIHGAGAFRHFKHMLRGQRGGPAARRRR